MNGGAGSFVARDRRGKKRERAGHGLGPTGRDTSGVLGEDLERQTGDARDRLTPDIHVQASSARSHDGRIDRPVLSPDVMSVDRPRTVIARLTEDERADLDYVARRLGNIPLTATIRMLVRDAAVALRGGSAAVWRVRVANRQRAGRVVTMPASRGLPAFFRRQIVRVLAHVLVADPKVVRRRGRERERTVGGVDGLQR